jgi:hypothetical protein
VRAHCEQIIPGAREKHIFAGDMSEQHAAVRECADGYSFAKIRP